MTPYFFGYGSLVNRATHDYPDARPAQLKGWRRCWVKTSARDALFLSVEPHAETTIDGLIAAVPNQDWSALDLREAAYARLPSGTAITHALDPATPVSHYAVQDRRVAPEGDHYIILSYLDIVVKGFLDEYGREGVERFFATTRGWEAPVLNDRATPRYPRYHKLSEAEEYLVTDHLARSVASPSRLE